MPILDISGGRIDLPRNVALLDTNILVSFFHHRDDLHDYARLTIEDDDRFYWLITGPVLVEACGMLFSRSKGLAEVFELMSWINTPGTRALLLSCAEGPNEHQQRLVEHTDFISRRKFDFVDGYLMRVATLIADLMGSRYIPIVTIDGDFYGGGGAGYRYGVLDWSELQNDVIPISGSN